MKKSIKQVVSFLLVFCMMAMTCMSAFATDSGVAKNNSIRVMIDGKDVVFGKAAPRIINGRTMVPFRAILESLGATVSYDKQTQVIGAKLGDTALSFKAKDAKLTIKNASGTSTVSMDVVPYLDAKLGSTYVSARFVAQAFDYKVDWDAANKCVVIIDFNKLLSSLESNYTIMGKFFKSNVDAAKTYKMVISMNMLAEMMGEEETIKLPISYKMDGLMKDKDLDSTINAAIDGELNNFKTELKMDGDESTFYTRSSLYKDNPITLADGTVVDDKTWIKMTSDDLNNAYAQMGLDIDFKELMSLSDKMSFSDTVKLILDKVDVPLDTTTYTSLSGTIKLIDTLFSDKAFTKSTKDGVTTYNTSSKSNALSSIISAAMPGASLNYDISISEKSGVLSKYNVTFKADMKDQNISVDFTLNGTDANNAVFKFSFSSNEVKISGNANVSMSETNESFTTTPAAGEKVVNYSDVMAALLAANDTEENIED